MPKPLLPHPKATLKGGWPRKDVPTRFRASGLVFDLALVSPALRARDTLDMILRELPQ
jgi:phosphohistidine phosphatase SixA